MVGLRKKWSRVTPYLVLEYKAYTHLRASWEIGAGSAGNQVREVHGQRGHRALEP